MRINYWHVSSISRLERERPRLCLVFFAVLGGIEITGPETLLFLFRQNGSITPIKNVKRFAATDLEQEITICVDMIGCHLPRRTQNQAHGSRFDQRFKAAKSQLFNIGQALAKERRIICILLH